VPDLTPAHIAILQKLVERGFTPVAFPLYASAIGVRRGVFAALLTPETQESLKLLGEPCYVVGSNLAVRTTRQGRAVFMWKQQAIEVTPEHLEELARFSADLMAAIAAPET